MSNGAGDEELVDFVRRARPGVIGGDALVVAVGERRVRVGGDVAARVLGALEGGEVAPRSAGAEGDRRSGLPAAAGGGLSAVPSTGALSAGAGAGGGVGPGARPPRVTLGDPAGVLGLAGAHGRRGVTEDLPPELTTGQAADLLGVSRRTVVQLIERGDLKATRVGTRRRLDTAEVAGHRERAKSKRPATLRDVIAASRDLDLYR
jgi:excisionase family DNA binding protein